MKKTLLTIFAFLLSSLVLVVNAQQVPGRPVPTDEYLRSLVNRHLQSPVSRTVNAAGEVFLQRDMTAYLQASFTNAPAVSAAEQDHGHDHKDAMLRAFLNRPHADVATMNRYFENAAAEFNVPVAILKATAQVQSNWAQVSESIYGSWGVMGLIENQFVQQLTQAAAILRLPVDDIKNDAKTNIRAAAALLAHHQRNKPASVTLEDWFESAKLLTGLWDLQLQNDLALRIYDVIETGSKSVTLWGEIIVLEATDISLPKRFTEPVNGFVGNNTSSADVDYPLAIPNFTTCNYNARPAGSVIKYYFVHYVATGTYQGAINWFKDCSSSVSAHYVIRNNDGQVSQVVAENDRAWSQGVSSYNDLGIGVEHEVLATNLAMWDSEPMLVSAANLCISVCNRRAIPKIRRINNGDAGIYGHSDVRATDCPNLTPARWTNFLTRVNSVNVAAPILYSVQNPGSGTSVMATWKANIEPTLAGYRLYYAQGDNLTSWSLAANETTLTSATTSVTLDATQFVVPPTGNVYHFKLTAVVTDGTNPVVESTAGDIYSRSSNVSGPKVLIVDGFDRTNGSYTPSTHSFATSYFKSLRNKAHLQISTVANEKVEDGTFALSNYDMVVWFLGDESSAHVVFSPAEKATITNYLNNGGKLILSGAEIGYNIGRSAAATYDLPFMTNYLKSTYVNDGSTTYTPATGITGTPFQGVQIPFGVVYAEESPDAIAPANGAIGILNYSVAPNIAGIAYKGLFGAGTVPGGLVFVSFTLETAADSSRTPFIGKALAYFDIPLVTVATALDDAGSTQTATAKRINVTTNDYGNGSAINPATLTIVTNPLNGTVTFDALGNVTYVSSAGFTGSDSYRYQVQNTDGDNSNIATVYINVVAAAPCNPSAPEVDDANPKRDLRGAWISTVSNIDWPSDRNADPTQQQGELITILETLARTGINTVYLQVRPEADALYASSIEPWSYWLTGVQGQAPVPLWDPLAFAITAAHDRGMELHAWLNPYRAKQSTPTLATTHVAVVHPEWTFVSGTLTMLNPGLPAVRDYVTSIVTDIATRYDVDGIHFDDYFYPSAGMTGQDNTTYTNNNPTAIATIEDWRRNNVNLLIAQVYDAIAAINTPSKNVVFGVSPFGIWKSGTPAGITGTSSFTTMYCDPIAWLQAGKVDYIAPQLYWKITGPQDYNSLSKWWNDQGMLYNRPVYPGLALYKMADANNWAASEIENQISLNRDQNHEQVKGQILFSTKQIMTDVKGIKTALQANSFRYKSFNAAMPWKDVVCPNAPTNIVQDVNIIRWTAPVAAADGDIAKRYVVYRFANVGEASTHIQDGKKVYAIVYDTQLSVPASDLTNSYFAVTALDEANNESEISLGVVVPVTGLQLTVTLNGNNSLVSWRTLTEINTSKFEIERSTDAVNFSPVGSLNAAGNSGTERRYNINDPLHVHGIYYYRIRSIDIDGRSTFSNVGSVQYRAGTGLAIAGPNPFTSYVNVTNLEQVERLDMIDLTGRTLAGKKINNQPSARFDVPGLPAGVYYLRVTKTTGEHQIIKLVKP